ncbi:MAG TPA: serine--tRNA ligase, partial [Thermosynergistes sp.]|nr:serine--tRNA ligase [Thermosynergistes sp.]
MLDLKWIRENEEEVRLMLKHRGANFPLDELLKLDAVRREKLTAVEALKARRNDGSKLVGSLKREGKDASALLDELRKLDEEIGNLDAEVSSIQGKIDELLLQIPNRVHASVPVGRDEEENVVVRTWG